MPLRFQKHYTREEARKLLPEIRGWLQAIAERRERLHALDQPLAAKLAGGADLGGPAVDRWLRTLTEIQDLLLEFRRREIQIKDLDRGLIDFPAILDGKEVFLCWEQDEEDIEFWHDLEAGYAGREPL